MRYFNGRPLELLAPAGNLDIFKSVVETGCDALYVGGQNLNMRLIRKGFNFSNEELTQAVELAHAQGKKLYVTVNNLIDPSELPIAREYLQFLQTIKPDALIVQDFAILQLARELNLEIDLHASVMMNVHNTAMVRELQRQGVSRVVLSRELSLEDARRIGEATGIEIEYFTHGDMCITHGSQCYASSYLFGMSSNRGRCLKPCRWWYSHPDSPTHSEEKTFPLAVKDLSLYEYLPEMIAAGVASLKIEGRMRDAAFITRLVSIYADALDRYLSNPEHFDRQRDLPELIETRKRDLSTAYAFGKPGAGNINTRFEGTGKFFSTGKMFSTPTKEREATLEEVSQIRSVLQKARTVNPSLSAQTADRPKLSVRVDRLDKALLAAASGVDRIYLAADIFFPDPDWDLAALASIRSEIANSNAPTELYMSTPRMMLDDQFERFAKACQPLLVHLDGFLVSNLGAIELCRSFGLPLAGDWSLNPYNPLAASFYLEQGLNMLTPSLELDALSLAELATGCQSLEVVVHGYLPAMYFEHDFHSALSVPDDKPVRLINEAGVFAIHKDHLGRAHLLTQRVFDATPFIPELQQLGISSIRIEGQLLDPEALAMAIQRVQSPQGQEILPESTLGAWAFFRKGD